MLEIQFFDMNYSSTSVNCTEYMVTEHLIITKWDGPGGRHDDWRYPEFKNWPLKNIKSFEAKDISVVTEWTPKEVVDD